MTLAGRREKRRPPPDLWPRDSHLVLCKSRVTPRQRTTNYKFDTILRQDEGTTGCIFNGSQHGS